MGGMISAEEIMKQLELMIRIVLAGICGGAIGYERESRKKTAGLRTHVIVAISAALMIVLSKYGFTDVLGQYVRLDPSRIAAGTVTAIGFLGSGIIFARNKNVSGVTTSAGIWATLGVGMAIGAGMYVIGIATTFLVVLVEIFIGRGGKLSHLVKQVYQIVVEYTVSGEEDERMIEQIRGELEDHYKCKILKFRTRREGQMIRVELLVSTSKGSELVHLAELAERYPAITRISI